MGQTLQKKVVYKETLYESTDDYTSDRLNRAPGLGNRGLDPVNPWVVAVRGVGARGGGENKPVKFNRSLDIRGESRVILDSLDVKQPLPILQNERLESSREGQIRQSSLRAPRRIQV
jgi:hypothetical protein